LVRKKEPFPSENDLVICTITRVFSHGAFAKLDEYEGKEGYIHISEIASTWIKNIRDFVRENQKTVAKVLSVDPQKGHVDLSVRRVGEAQKKNKIQEWKRAQKAEKLLELAAKQIKRKIDDVYDEVGFKLEDRYGEIYGALEEISLFKEEALEGIDIPKEWIKPLIKVVKENVELPLVHITGYLDLKCHAPNGIEIIKDALIKARDENSDERIKLEIRYVGSPRYRVRVVAPDYKIAENALRKVAASAISLVEKNGGIGTFLREVKGEQ
jgi:translation initiation factor 2 subunit 1